MKNNSTNKPASSFLRTLLLAFSAAVLFGDRATAAEYNAERDFQTNSNPNGVWTYGAKTTIGGGLNLLNRARLAAAPNGVAYEVRDFSSGGLPYVLRYPLSNTNSGVNGSAMYPPGTLLLQAGNANTQRLVTVRFTAPTNGAYRVDASVAPANDMNSQGDTDFHITKNGIDHLSAFLTPTGRVSYVDVLTLASGDTVDFSVGPGADNNPYGSILRLSATITGPDVPPTVTNPPPSVVFSNFNLVRDFSTNANPNGAWSYGWQSNLGGVFGLNTANRTAFAENGVPYQVLELPGQNPPHFLYFSLSNTATGTSAGGQAQYPPGTLIYYAGNNGTPYNFAVCRFTAPSNSSYQVEVAVRHHRESSTVGDTDFHVLRDGTEIFGQALPPGGATAYTNVVTLSAGATLDFALGRGADQDVNNSVLKIQAIITPMTNGPVTTNPPPVVYSDFNAARDFSTNTNPNGVWSYGAQNVIGSPLSLMPHVRTAFSPTGIPYDLREITVGGLPNVMHYPVTNAMTATNGNSVFPPGTLLLHPARAGGTQNLAVVRFTAPSNGTYRVDASALPAYDGTPQGDTDYHVVRNGQELFAALLNPTERTAYSNIVALTAGDTLDFAVGRGADNSEYGSVLKIQAIITPTTNAPVVTNPPPADYGNFHLTRDFTTNNNPNGVWSYGWKESLGSALGFFTRVRTISGNNGVPVQVLENVTGALPDLLFNATTNTATSDGGQGQYPPRTLWFYPGSDGSTQNFGAIRFTAPSNSSFQVGVAVRAYLDGPSSGDTDFHVVKNGTEVFGVNVPPRGATNFTNVVALVAGETLDFLVGRGADGTQYGSALKIEALLAPTTNSPVITNPPPVVYSDFDAARDFSTNTNPNGVWSYGGQAVVGSQFTLMPRVRRATAPNGVPYNVREFTIGGIPDVMHYPFSNTIPATNGNSVFPPGTLLLHSGANSGTQSLAVLRFSAPSNGNYQIEASAFAAYDGTPQGDTDYHVAKNGQEIFAAFLNPADRVGYTNIVALLAGDTVDFAVGRGLDNSDYASFLKIQAIITPTTNRPTVTNVPPTVFGDFDLSRDFLNSVNPSGVWSYGWKETLGGPLGSLGSVRTFASDNGVPIRAWELNVYNLPVVAKVIGNSTAVSDSGRFTAPPGTVYFAPGADSTPQNFGAIRFTAPSNGNYRIETSVKPLFDGTRSRDSDFHVTVRGGEIHGAFLPPNFGTNSFTAVVALQTGDNVDFLIGRGADGLTYDTGLKISATLTPTTNAPTITNVPPPIVHPNFDLSRDFLNATNPSGVWNYGWKETLGGPLGSLGSVRTFSSDNGVPICAWELTTYSLPVVAKVIGNSTAMSDGTHFVAPPDTVYFAPGADATPQNFGVIRFIAPSNGNYRVETTVKPLFDGSRSRDSDFHVVRNGLELYGISLPPNFGTNRFSAIVSLGTGETIDFAIGRGNDGFTSDTGLKIAAVVTPTSEPPIVTNPPPVVPGDFHLTRDFSTNQNPNAVWSYGWKGSIASNFNLFAHTRTAFDGHGSPFQVREIAPGALPALYFNHGTNTLTSDGGQAVYPPGTMWYYPASSPNNFGAVRFTAPSNSNYQVGVAVRSYIDGPSSGDTDFHVVKNGVEVFGQAIPSRGATSYTNVLSLGAGDVLEFLVGRGADDGSSGSGLKIQALIVPTAAAPISSAPGESKAARVTSFTRLANGDIEFGIAGDGATAYIIEASTDLVNWTEIGLVANASNTIRFADPDAAVYPNRFYRARAAQ